MINVKEAAIPYVYAWLGGRNVEYTNTFFYEEDEEYPWYTVDDISIFAYSGVNFRFAPIRPSIDWSHVVRRYNFLAQDQYGDCYLFDSEPTVSQYNWIQNRKGKFMCKAEAFESLKPGLNRDWKKSLVQRPPDDSNCMTPIRPQI